MATRQGNKTRQQGNKAWKRGEATSSYTTRTATDLIAPDIAVEMLPLLHLALLTFRSFIPINHHRQARAQSMRVGSGPEAQTRGALGLDKILQEMIEESDLEVNAQLVELPVMFVDEANTTTFDFERWNKHRSETRYFKIPLGALLGVTTRRISWVVIPLMLFSSGVCLYGQACLTDPTLPTIQLPLQPFELTAPALGLLLVFRSDNAFSRFGQGSELSWDITTSVRSAMRRLLSFTGAPCATAAERAAAEELTASLLLLHYWIMNEHLRAGGGSRKQHQDLLTNALGTGAESIDGFGVTPYHGIEAISLGARQRLPSLTDQEFIAFDDCLSTVTSDLGKCERLLRTPIPLGYTRYSVRFLWIWLTLLPFALTRTFCGFQAGTWWEGRVDEPWPLVVSSVTFIAAIFLSIEDISVQIEEPFAVLPLDIHHGWLVRDVESSRQLMAWSSQTLDDAPQGEARPGSLRAR